MSREERWVKVRDTRRRDLSFEKSLADAAGTKPHMVHFFMARMLTEISQRRRMTKREEATLYHRIQSNGAYRRRV